MSTSPNSAGQRVQNVRFGNDSLSVDLVDGRTISGIIGTWPAPDMASVGPISTKT